MPKIKKIKIEQCTKIFIYRDLNQYVGIGEPLRVLSPDPV